MAFLFLFAIVARVAKFDELLEPVCLLVDGSEGAVSSDAFIDDKVATRLLDVEPATLLELAVEVVDAEDKPVTEEGAFPSAC